jgi:nucleoside triphosphate pyrophosphatase
MRIRRTSAILASRMPRELLILASASPRRAELLTSAGYAFVVEPADVDESLLPGEPPEVYALRVARAKADEVAARHPHDGIVLAADTVVVAGRDILGKPVDAADAARMLTRLSGTVHEVLTAVVVRRPAAELTELVRTRVQFIDLTAEDIAWYIRTGEPEGKAGAYAIQGRGARFVDRIEGSWSNVVGLPLATVARMLGEARRVVS